MLKQKDYNIADSNLANFGSELEKNIKTAAAKTDPAWKDVGKQVGLEVFRIEKFTVKKWRDIGHFYSGDSYIVLNTYKKENALMWDVHFWLGAETTQDEAGPAAYKTVELDDVLGGAPIQHREVQDHESPQFIKYFNDFGGIRIMEGGIDSGFNHIKPEEYKPRLLWVKGRKNVRVVQVPMEPASLNDGDVFVLDAGLKLYQWQGRKAGPSERAKAGQLCRAIDDERKGLPELFTFVNGDGDRDQDAFWELLGGKADVAGADSVPGDAEWEKGDEKALYVLSDKTGSLKFTEVCRGEIPAKKLETDDVNIIDVGNCVYVWVGKGSNDNERKSALSFAQNYLKSHGRPNWLPIVRILEGGENEEFKSYLVYSRYG